MGFNGADDGGGGKIEAAESAASVSCSICLDVVMKNGDRSWAKLQCGHQFHLDCIGSAFNSKGAMQCPNCRKVEKGQWLYANGCRSLPEFHVDDWAHDDDLYDMGYSEVPFAVQWCPFSGLTHLPSSFEEGDLSSGPYNDLPGQHAVLSEHTSISSSGHPCPYMAYLGPIYPSSANTSGSSESSNFSNTWNGPSPANEMSSSYTFPVMDVHYPSWEHHTSTLPMNNRIGGSGQTSIPLVRVARTNSEIPVSGSFMHPFIVGHRGGSTVASMFPPHPGSVARALDRVQAFQAYFQQPSASLAVRAPVLAGTGRSSSHRGLSQVGPVGSSSDQNGGFYFFPQGSSAINSQDVENLMQNRFHAWEYEHSLPHFLTSQVDTDLGYAPFLQATTSDPDSGTRSSSSRHRHGTDRTPSQNWS